MNIMGKVRSMQSMAMGSVMGPMNTQPHTFGGQTLLGGGGLSNVPRNPGVEGFGSMFDQKIRGILSEGASNFDAAAGKIIAGPAAAPAAAAAAAAPKGRQGYGWLQSKVESVSARNVAAARPRSRVFLGHGGMGAGRPVGPAGVVSAVKSGAGKEIRTFAMTNSTQAIVRYGGGVVAAAGMFGTYNNLRDGRYGRAAMTAGLAYGGAMAFTDPARVLGMANNMIRKINAAGQTANVLERGAASKMGKFLTRFIH